MKKLINSALVLAITALTFSSCEDVPAPYGLDFNGNKGGEVVVSEPTGDGTLASPYNAAKAIEIVKAGTYTTDKVYIKGVITSIKEMDTEKYGNASFYIGDSQNSKTTFYIYRTLGLGGNKFTTGKEIAVGDTIVAYAQLFNYDGTPETYQGGQLVSINGTTSSNTGGNTTNPSTVTPSGEGTAASPYNIAKAQSVIASLSADAPTEEVYISGTVVGTPSLNTQYNSATYYLSDDGTEAGKLYVYGGKSFNGEAFTTSNIIKQGDKVVIKGKLVNYKGNTPEVTTNSQLVSVNGKTTSDNTGDNTGGNTGGTTTAGGLTIDGTTVTAVNSAVTAGTTTVTVDLNAQGFTDKAEVSTVTLSDESTITFGAGTNERNKPVFYSATKGVRMYANNTISFACKGTIAKIVFTCDAFNGTNYVGNETATITYDGKNAVYTNAFASASGGVQLRVQTITITYAN